MELGDLMVEFPCHETLPPQLHAMHLRLDATPNMVSAPSSSEGPAKVFRGAQGLVSDRGSGSDGVPRFGVLAGRDDRVGAAISEGIVALAGVVGTVGGYRADLFANRDLAEQIGQDGCASNVPPSDLDGSDLQRFLVDPQMDLAPDPPLWATMLSGVPLAFPLDLDARAVDEQA